MELALETISLSKNYGRSNALSNFSINVPRGSIYGLVGRNGSGKTTLIRLVCGLQTPSSGEYKLFGINSTDKGFVNSRKRIGAVVEIPSVFLDLTAEENLMEQYLILGLPSFNGIGDILKLVGLESTGNKKAKNFSLGMRQRLGIAISLAGNPDFLILDEPLNGLDPQGIIEVRELILKLNREFQITVLISSHLLGELSKLATHYGFVEKGSMVKEVSAEVLHASCQKYTKVKVSDTKVLAYVLDELNIKYEIASDTEANIFEKINVTELTVALLKNSCELITVNEPEESLESYFMNLVGGGHHD